MKYRIKIINYKSGRKSYLPQVKKFIGWASIGYEGSDSYVNDASECNSREEALNRIDSHFSGNTRKYNIEFEYIKKSKVS